MSKLSSIPWMSPQKKLRSVSVVPRVTVTSKGFKTGDKHTTAPYWRVAFNKAFMEKYYPTDPKIKKMSVYVGGQGILFDPRPVKDQPYYEIRKGNYWNDYELVTAIFKHINVPILSAPKISTVHLHGKPFGKFDEKTIHQMIYINEENPDTTQLAGLKQKMELDENFPDQDAPEKGQTIKVEG